MHSSLARAALAVCAPLLAAQLAACTTTMTPAPVPAARSVAGVSIAAPLPPRPVSDTFYGTQVDDPWRYAENVSDPTVAAWMKGQADATQQILARIPGRDALLARVREIDAAAAGQVSAVQRTDSGRLFFLRREPGENQFKLIVRDGTSGPDRVLVDAEALGKRAGQPLAILDFAPSHDGRHLAYTLQVGGSEIGEVHVMEVQSGRDIVAPIDRIRFAGATWLRDGTGFFFARLREGYETMPSTEKFGDRTTHFFSMATKQAQPVFSTLRNPELKLPLFAGAAVFEIPGTRLAALAVFLGVDRNQVLYLGDLKAATEGKAQWRKVFDAADEVRNFSITRDWIYVLSAKGTPRHRLLRMPLNAPELAKAEVVVPASEEVLVSVAAARDAAYLIKRRGPAMQLVRLPHAAPIPQAIALPFEGSVGVLWADSNQEGLLFSVTGWTRATQRFAFTPNAAPGAAPGAAPTPITLARAGAFDAPPELMAREVTVPGADGTPIPVSILSRRDVKLDGNNPTVLFGYGSYGITENPGFNPRLIAWLERGGVYVYAHVRGGGMFGTEWHLAGQKANKPNTWRDGIAVAQWLIANKYTSSQRLAIFGGSAGGIFVGMAINERPDLFVAAVPAVPVMDTVRAELDPNGPANIPEFGTVKEQAGFNALRAMSSYHAIKPGTRYPAVLLVHGVNDTRVAVWQSTKYANRLASASTGGPVLMRLDYQLGHGGGAALAQQQEQTVDIWSFMLWQMGVPEFQPK
jgi:prolyl oligopeptidase